MTKKILITGSGGFIGSFLKNHYAGQHTVFAPGHSVLDLTNKETVDTFFEKNNIDTVIHCALVGRDRINAVDPNLTMQNLEMFKNLWRNKHKFKKLINCGTGNELDTNTNIFDAREDELYEKLPAASYGYSKNLIARIIANTENFYNLRLFGVFHHTENPRRFFKLLKNSSEENPCIIFQNQYFDFLNLEDVVPMINTIMNNEAQHRDINMVYQEKYLLSEQAYMFADEHDISHKNIIVENKSDINFSGNGEKFASYNFNLKGLHDGFRKYKK
jgi:nucleoside-diphosphate-sugar epimerase